VIKEKILRFNLYLGLFILILSAFLLILNNPFVKSWFYCLAWWSSILIIDSLNFRRSKSSPLSDSFKHFLFTAFISVFVWLLFELFNLRIKNWTYQDLPHQVWRRWIGYFIAFASVIPAVREIALFIRSFFERWKFHLFRIRASSLLLKIFIFFGIFSVFLILAWPRIFFPLSWLCFIFLLEPLNYWLKNKTFLRDLERKRWSNLMSWILAGFAAGFLWEFFNFWAGSHWQYSLPYLNFGKVFQMPALGYTGFLPFALEIFAFYHFLSWAYEKLKRRIIVKSIAIIFLLLFYVTCFYLIDTFTLIR